MKKLQILAGYINNRLRYAEEQYALPVECSDEGDYWFGECNALEDIAMALDKIDRGASPREMKRMYYKLKEKK